MVCGWFLIQAMSAVQQAYGDVGSILCGQIRAPIYAIVVCLLLCCGTIFGQYAHKDVILNAQYEDRLPAHLKNAHYRNPRVREVLAYYSWFGPGETPVYRRAADLISRREIYKVLSHAGLIQRRYNFHH